MDRRGYTLDRSWLWCIWALALAVCPPAIGDHSSATPDSPVAKDQISDLLSESSYIDSLLIKKEFPVIGGRWGWEAFIDAPLNSEPDGAKVTLRRAKLKYVRNFGNNWRLKLTGDYSSGGGLELSDTYVSYSGWKQALLTLGISDPAFSLESVSQSSALTFMERGLAVTALSEGKSGGVSFLKRSPHSILNASLLLFSINQDNLREKGQGVVLHYVYSPVEYGKADSVHLGGSFSYRINSSEDSTRFRSRPEVATVNDYFVDTGAVAGAERVSRLSLEASQVLGRFSWQSEILGARVHRAGFSTVEFWGAYAYASWFLTQDRRRYDFGSGSFEQVQVGSPVFQGGAGAFELGLRLSYVDLTDQDITGGKERNLSLGLNWYLNQRARLMFNLVKVLDLDRPGSEFDGQDPLIFSLRAQWVVH